MAHTQKGKRREEKKTSAGQFGRKPHTPPGIRREATTWKAGIVGRGTPSVGAIVEIETPGSSASVFCRVVSDSEEHTAGTIVASYPVGKVSFKQVQPDMKRALDRVNNSYAREILSKAMLTPAKAKP